jgi:hypothetical protein
LGLSSVFSSLGALSDLVFEDHHVDEAGRVSLFAK